jgi:hypothetical protein
VRRSTATAFLPFASEKRPLASTAAYRWEAVVLFVPWWPAAACEVNSIDPSHVASLQLRGSEALFPDMTIFDASTVTMGTAWGDGGADGLELTAGAAGCAVVVAPLCDELG